MIKGDMYYIFLQRLNVECELYIVMKFVLLARLKSIILFKKIESLSIFNLFECACVAWHCDVDVDVDCNIPLCSNSIIEVYRLS
jgi:hypothetical protein